MLYQPLFIASLLLFALHTLLSSISQVIVSKPLLHTFKVHLFALILKLLLYFTQCMSSREISSCKENGYYGRKVQRHHKIKWLISVPQNLGSSNRGSLPLSKIVNGNSECNDRLFQMTVPFLSMLGWGHTGSLFTKFYPLCMMWQGNREYTGTLFNRIWKILG